MSKTKILIFQSKATSKETILFDGKITHQLHPEITKVLVRSMFGKKNSKFHCVQIYFLSKLNSISETDNGIQFKLQCDINHGPNWNVEFSIPIQPPTDISLIVGS